MNTCKYSKIQIMQVITCITYIKHANNVSNYSYDLHDFMLKICIIHYSCMIQIFKYFILNNARWVIWGMHELNTTVCLLYCLVFFIFYFYHKSHTGLDSTRQSLNKLRGCGWLWWVEHCSILSFLFLWHFITFYHTTMHMSFRNWCFPLKRCN